MRRGIAAVGAVIAAGLVIERIRAMHADNELRPDATSTSRSGGPNAYCLTCKATRQMQAPQTLVMRNGKLGTRGQCPVCGKGLVSMGSLAA
jgi:Domain of unknown function (DUF5679)